MKAEKRIYDYYGLTCYEVDGKEYAVGTDKECKVAARRFVRETLWAFRTDYLAGYLNWEESVTKAIRKVQEDLCEDANPVIAKLIGSSRDIDTFCDTAIDDDGRGHFLASYDGEEIDSDSIEGLPKGLIAYRIH